MIRWFGEHNKVSWAITIFGAVMIFYLSSISYFPDFNKVGTNTVSMIYHVSAFFCFALFLFISVRRINYVFVLTIIIAMFYGFLDEVHQLFVAGRFIINCNRVSAFGMKVFQFHMIVISTF